MSATIVWEIEWMQCLPTDGQYTNVVVEAGWRCTGTQVAGTPEQTYTSSAYGTSAFTMPGPNDPNFTPYADLTQDQVLGWCWASGVDRAAIETGIQTGIDNQINPPIIQPPLPWTTPAA